MGTPSPRLSLQKLTGMKILMGRKIHNSLRVRVRKKRKTRKEELEETKKSLKDARANLSRIIREKTELSRENSAITVSKETIGDDKEELESQLNLTSVSLAASEEGLRVTRGQLAETVENLHRVQEINTR